jgi:hypothetical protein
MPIPLSITLTTAVLFRQRVAQFVRERGEEAIFLHVCDPQFFPRDVAFRTRILDILMHRAGLAAIGHVKDPFPRREENFSGFGGSEFLECLAQHPSENRKLPDQLDY